MDITSHNHVLPSKPLQAVFSFLGMSCKLPKTFEEHGQRKDAKKEGTSLLRFRTPSISINVEGALHCCDSDEPFRPPGAHLRNAFSPNIINQLPIFPSSYQTRSSYRQTKQVRNRQRNCARGALNTKIGEYNEIVSVLGVKINHPNKLYLLRNNDS